MSSSLYSNIVSSVGWYLDIKSSRHMTYNRSPFNRFYEKEGGMSVEVGDNATYHVKGVGLLLDSFR
jgi:hypothetical protein